MIARGAALPQPQGGAIRREEEECAGVASKGRLGNLHHPRHGRLDLDRGGADADLLRLTRPFPVRSARRQQPDLPRPLVDFPKAAVHRLPLGPPGRGEAGPHHRVIEDREEQDEADPREQGGEIARRRASAPPGGDLERSRERHEPESHADREECDRDRHGQVHEREERSLDVPGRRQLRERSGPDDEDRPEFQLLGNPDGMPLGGAPDGAHDAGGRRGGDDAEEWPPSHAAGGSERAPDDSGDAQEDDDAREGIRGAAREATTRRGSEESIVPSPGIGEPAPVGGAPGGLAALPHGPGSGDRRGRAHRGPSAGGSS